MTTVSFFCTRCRRLTTFPASRRGAIVYCPRCQQALIVPDIPPVGESEDERPLEKDGRLGENAKDGEFAEDGERGRVGEKGGARRTVGEQDDGRVEENASRIESEARRGVATVASHLSPGKKRAENWRRVGVGGNGAGDDVWGTAGEANGVGGELDEAALWESKEVSDAEFLSRLRDEPRSRLVAPPPVAPSSWASAPSETPASDSCFRIPKLAWPAIGALALAGAFVVGALWAEKRRIDGGDVNVEGKEAATSDVFLEGALTYRTNGGETAPDEGAFVFLFPSEERFGAPIALGNASPQRPTPPGFETVVADLEARGARFAVADFEGRFAIADLEPGEYRALFVSRCVRDDWGKANPAALKEIERYVVSPRLLLDGNRFFWTTRRFDRDAATFEKSFGKTGAPFSNVE